MQTTTKLRPQPTQPLPKLTSKVTKRDATFINAELRSMLDDLAAHPDIFTKVELFSRRSYSKNKFQEWHARYGDNSNTQELLKKIEEILEARLVSRGIKQPNPAFIIFLLKNNYGYQDKREIATDNTYTFNVTRGLPTGRKPIKATVVNPPIPVNKNALNT